MKVIAALSILCQLATSASAAYSLTREYSGASFFDRWNFVADWDRWTNGDVWYQSRSAAKSQHLVSVNSAGNAILRVDNTTNVPVNGKRNSVRIESKDNYGLGSIIMMDLVHMPFGCSVWPAFWTNGVGRKWPDAGEIDIIEGINMRTYNSMTVHTNAGCTQPSGVQQVGQTISTDCAKDGGGPGCTVVETKKGSFGPDFAAMGGGVFALKFDDTGIFIWFWSRADVPTSCKLSSAKAKAKSVMDTSDWGLPSAAWPCSSCNTTQYFTPQQLILDITLCGGYTSTFYNDTCPPPKISCTADNVFGSGHPTYDNAYFEIQWLRVYSQT